MRVMRLVRAVPAALLIATVGLPALASARQGQSSEAAPEARQIRSLFEEAEYERALRVAAGLDLEALDAEAAREVRIYQALCLLALGRTDEADRQLEEVIRRDPAYQPGDDMPNRLRTAVAGVRNRLAPELAHAHLTAGRELYAAGKPDAAIAEFDLALAVTNLVPASALPRREDVQTLASGFKALASRAAAVLSAGPNARRGSEVVEPRAVTQELPPWPDRPSGTSGSTRTSVRSGLLEVVISNAGTVKSARLVEAIDPVYDQVLLNAAKEWEYLPATRGGLPIEYVKRLTISVK